MSSVVKISSPRKVVVLDPDPSRVVTMIDDVECSVTATVTPINVSSHGGRVVVEHINNKVVNVRPVDISSGKSSNGYNFLEITSPSDGSTTNNDQVVVIGKTMRKSGIDSDLPSVTINGIAAVPTKLEGAVYSFSETVLLEEGENIVSIVSDNGIVLTKEFTITRATMPSIDSVSVAYPAGQDSLKSGEEATVTITCHGSYDSVEFGFIDDIIDLGSGTLSLTRAVKYTGSGDYKFSTNATIQLSNSSNGTSISQTFSIALNDVTPSGTIKIKRAGESSYLSSPVLPVGLHTVSLTTNRYLSTAPSMNASVGALGSFSGSGTSWHASLVIPSGAPEIDTGLFNNATMVGTSGISGHEVTGVGYTIDKIAPEITSLVCSNHDWYPSDGSVVITAIPSDMSDVASLKVNLSSFGGSSSASMTKNASNFTLTFTPSAADVVSTNIIGTVTDVAGNHTSFTGESLETSQYKVSPQDLYFPAYTDTTEAGSSFSITSNVHVEWGSVYPRTGTLSLGTDYTITDMNKITFTSAWVNDVQSNSLGNMYITCWET